MRPDPDYTGLLLALAIAPSLIVIAWGVLLWLFAPGGKETEKGFEQTEPCAWDNLRCLAAEAWHMVTSKRPMSGDDWEDE